MTTLTGKTIGQLVELSNITDDTLFAVELGGKTYHIPYSKLNKPFTGNTSGDCINDIYVSNIHSCSPLNINPNDEGNIYFGSTSAITVDLLNNQFDVNGKIKTTNLQITSGATDGYVLTSDSEGNAMWGPITNDSNVNLGPVLDNTLNTPPSNPSEGDRYIISSGATGDWSGEEQNIAQWNDSDQLWEFYIPQLNDRTIVTTGTNAGKVYEFNGTTWNEVIVPIINSTPFFLNGTTIDAGSNKTSNISRTGGLCIGTTNNTIGNRFRVVGNGVMDGYNTRAGYASTSDITRTGKFFAIADFDLNYSVFAAQFYTILMSTNGNSNGSSNQSVINFSFKRQNDNVYIYVNLEQKVNNQGGNMILEPGDIDFLYNNTTKKIRFYYKQKQNYSRTSFTFLNGSEYSATRCTFLNQYLNVTNLSGEVSDPVASKTLNFDNGENLFTKDLILNANRIHNLSGNSVTFLNSNFEFRAADTATNTIGFKYRNLADNQNIFSIKNQGRVEINGSDALVLLNGTSYSAYWLTSPTAQFSMFNEGANSVGFRQNTNDLIFQRGGAGTFETHTVVKPNGSWVFGSTGSDTGGTVNVGMTTINQAKLGVQAPNGNAGETTFGVRNNTDTGWLVEVKNDGNIGINNPNPTEKLDISGKTKTTNFQMTSGATDGYILKSDTNGNANWASPGTILPPTLNYGLFAQTGDSAVVSATTIESTIIDGGVGTLSVPVNGFNIGDSFKVAMGGIFSNANNETIRLRVKSGSVDLVDSGVQTLSAHSNDIFKLEITFTIRNIGGPGVASIKSFGSFQTIKKNSANINGFGFELKNNTTFDTTISNTLDITVTWGSNNVNNSIMSQTLVLNKIY